MQRLLKEVFMVDINYINKLFDINTAIFYYVLYRIRYELSLAKVRKYKTLNFSVL